MPIILGLVAVGAVWGWAAGKTGNAIEQSGKPVKWLVAGGVVYVGYKALKTGGSIK